MKHEITLLTPNADLAGLHRLNEAHATELSSCDMETFRKMVGEAFVARAILPDHALLLAFDKTADYASVNFLWFKRKYDRFVYVDRIVVSRKLRRQQIAKRLYEELFEEAKAAGQTRIVCEVNIDPPNPHSDRFHEQLGFVETGMATLAGQDEGKRKTVRYLVREL